MAQTHNGVEDLLDMLHDMVEDAFTVPFGRDKSLVDKDQVLGLLDEIIQNLPNELRKARTIVDTKNDLLNSAKAEAEKIVHTAEERAKRMVSEHEITLAARQHAGELENQTRAKTRDVLRATNEYVEDILKRTEDAINTALGEVRRSRAEFRGNR